MKFLRILLFPVSLLYACIVYARNKLYDFNILPSTSFTIPTIVVGNLSVGGTGKSPHIEYIIRLLKNETSLATLSRGYGRKSKGFILADTHSPAETIGDEPMQFKNKFNEIAVAVDENRVNGINKLLSLFPDLKLILLDDAFQHRAVKPGLAIVLTDYSNLYFNDWMMPTGTLREGRGGMKRADIIIITKCPQTISSSEKEKIIKKINPSKQQKIFFSFIKYRKPVSLFDENKKEVDLNNEQEVLVLTAIANTSSLENYLFEKTKNIISQKFNDHHIFTENEIKNVIQLFNSIESKNKIILTTEKDAMRLKSEVFKKLFMDVPIFYLPIEIDFNETDKSLFNKEIIDYVRKN